MSSIIINYSERILEAMANEKNLIPFNALTQSEQRAIASQGGQASGAARRQYKKQKDIIKELLTLDVPDDTMKEMLKKLGIDPSFGHGINFSLALKALSGDTEAAKYVRDTAGEKPAQAVEVSTPSGPIQIDEKITSLTDAELKKLATE